MNVKRLRFVLTLLVSSPSIILIYTPLLIALTVIGVAIPFITGDIVNGLITDTSRHDHDIQCGTTWMKPYLILLILSLLKTLLTPILQRFICMRSRTLETDLQFRVLDATMALSPSQLDGIASGELVAKLTRDCYSVGAFVREFYPRLLQAAVMMLAAGYTLHFHSKQVSVGFMMLFPLTLALFAPFAHRFAENSHQVRRQGDASFNSLFDFLLALPMLRALGAERRFADAPQSAINNLRKGNSTSDSLSVRFGFLLSVILAVGELAVIGISSRMAARGEMPIGNVVLYQMLFISAILSIQGVIGLLPELAAVREGIDSLNEVFGNSPPDSGREHIGTIDQLTFSHVTFAYPSTPARPIVRDLSATFRTGTVIGISGMNGVGKSTLLKLAAGALLPQRGEILVNGHSLGAIDSNDLRRQLGFVFQDSILINGTVKENITLRDPDLTDKDIDSAIAASGFDTVVKRLPNGLATPIGNRIRTLSGGERQRLAIARAIIRNPSILIFDEATNHLDAESRQTIAELISRLRQRCIIILAGHDAELNKLCDVKISCQIIGGVPYISTQ